MLGLILNSNKIENIGKIVIRASKCGLSYIPICPLHLTAKLWPQ